jgi:hypothetical protein
LRAEAARKKAEERRGSLPDTHTATAQGNSSHKEAAKRKEEEASGKSAREPELKVTEVVPERKGSQVEYRAESIQHRGAEILRRDSASVFVRSPPCAGFQ